MRPTRRSTRAMAGLTLITALGASAAGLLGTASAEARPVPHAETTTATPATPATEPLAVEMTSLIPSTIPRKGTITISGTVQNVSKEDWSDINLAPFIASEPITTRDELAQAAASDPTASVGARLTEPSALVGDLAPGQRTRFSLRIKRSALPITGAPGVYWIGVHALGTSPEGRDLVADGRARSFIPLVPKSIAASRTVPVSVVLPLRDRARRAADGSLNGPARWVNLTRSSGRLSRLVDFGASAGSSPLTWLVDPSIVDALQDFGRGNPPISLSSSTSGTGSGTGDQDTSSPSASPSPAPSSGTPSSAARADATHVLDTFLSSARVHDVLALGYGDPDVSALARRGPNLLRRADQLTARALQRHDLIGAPVVAPPSGYVDPDLLGRLPTSTTVLLSDHDDLTQPPLSRLPTGQDLVLSDERAGNGGPPPTSAHTPLALRQRILSEAALEATKGEAAVRPVVVQLPRRWDPGPDWREADFFGGLQVPWLRLAPVPHGATSAYDGVLAYGKAQLADEIRATNITATRRLTHTSGVLAHLLTDGSSSADTDVTDELVGAALQASSYSAKPTQQLAADQVYALDGTTRSQMNKVQVTGTDFVTLSGGSGSLTVTLVNGLEQPVTVGLRARSDSPGVKVDLPDPVSIQAHQRTTLRLQVSSKVGIHEITLLPVTSQGEAAGTPLTFSLRTSQVGRLIWYIIIAGGVLLAVMIVRRIVLRIRLRRWRVEG